MGRFIDHPLVGDVRGVGLVSALEMMADKATRTPFDPARKVGTIADKHARENGLIVRSIGDRIAFSPPLIITEAEVDELAVRLQKTLDATWAELRTH
jgi:4-aminobutyrate--pyruvate transaminase